MNIYKKDGRWVVKCHVCNEEHGTEDIIIHNQRVYGIFCRTILGYEWDIPQEAKAFV